MLRSIMLVTFVLAGIFGLGTLSCAVPASAYGPEHTHKLVLHNGSGGSQQLDIICSDETQTCVIDPCCDAPDETAIPSATVFLPTVTKSPPVVPTAQPQPTSAPSGLVRVNSATVDELEALPHVGPVIRARIVEARPLTSCADADTRVKGWGATMVAETCPLIDWTP